MNKSFAILALVAVAAMSHADILKFTAVLNGAQENPPTSSTATGTGYLEIDTDTLAYSGWVKVSGLTGEVRDAHIHAGPVGLNGSVIYGFGILNSVNTGGVFEKSFSGVLTTKSPAAPAILAGTYTPQEQIDLLFKTGKTYFNVHTGQFPGGEVRGQINPVPEPATMLVLAAGLAFLRRKR